MKKTDKQTKAVAAAHIKFALALHDAYSAIGTPVRPIKLKPGSKSRRETLLKQIKRLQDKLDRQWYSDCPALAEKFDSIYLNEDWAKEADKVV
ncbi:MAG: hypothetical protein ACO1TE_20230 [Prosthecobacter sp.]